MSVGQMKCCDMHSGMLKEPVTFQRETTTSDGAGGYTRAWGPISGAPDRAHVKALSGFERWASERTEAQSKWRIVCRYFDGLTEADRVIIRSKEYNITFINNVDLADKWLQIDLSGGVAT